MLIRFESSKINFMDGHNPLTNIISSINTDTWRKRISTGAFCIVIIAILVAVFSGFGSRWGWWGFRTGLKFFRYSFYIAALGLLSSLVSLGMILYSRTKKNILRTSLALFFSFIMVVIPLSWYHSAKNVPAIHDITTDTQNPPKFVAILPLRKNALNSAEYGGPKIAEKQKKAYPDIQPLMLSIPPSQVFEQCLSTAKQMGWKIVDSNESDGRIEATDQTFWFGFKDDIVIRVTAQGENSRVDIRSVSRVGLSDVGTNAKRIRKFLSKFNKSA